jgi:glycosyltransferase involved in cell wall biosynthesis
VPSEYLVEVFARHALKSVPIANHLDVDTMLTRERAAMVPRFFSNRNFESHYNARAVVEAFATVQRSIPDAELVIAGNGSLRGALESQVKSLNLRNVTFTGAVPPDRMPALYAEADVYVNASLIDNMPLSLLEAYASGVPVVTSDAGGIPWIAEDQETALVVPAGDVAALASAMLLTLAHPDEAAQRAGKARAFVVSRFAWNSVAAQWVEAYVGQGEPTVPTHAQR